MKKVLSLFIACLMVVGVFSVATAEAPKSLKIAVVCSAAGRNDNGYNQSAVEGAEAVAAELGAECNVVQPENGVPAALETLAEDGYNLIFNLEYDFDALIKGVGGAQPIAAQYPDTWFVVFNANPNVNDAGETIHKNVISVLFDVHEGSYLAGYLSVLVNENATALFGEGYQFTPPEQARALGFIGGTDSSGIKVFSYGFIEGANKAAAELGVTYDYYAKYDAGFGDPALGSTVAGTYYDNGANVVYGVAGSVGDGITAKAKEVGKLAIQVDANKDDQQPGYVLTSVLKNTNVPVTVLARAYADGSIATLGNLQTYNLASGATGITDLSEIGKAVVDTAKWEEIKAKVAAIAADIAGGAIKVVNAQVGETFDPAACPNIVIK
ncbi:MAG: BMP family ABC transporter substrate-binding protein [Clostridiales bacterium]|nr:BMP family ABC transporter substrate-binding protein [Clostridiales bacterium]